MISSNKLSKIWRFPVIQRVGMFCVLLLLVGCISQSKGPPLRAISPTVNYTPEQVHAICYAEAVNAAVRLPQTTPEETSTFNYPTGVKTSCVTSGSYTTCNSTPQSGGFASGFADGYANAQRQRSARGPQPDKRAIYFSCVAKHGYTPSE